MFFCEAKNLSQATQESSPEYMVLKSCIDRAVRYLDQGKLRNAQMSFLSDIHKCSELNQISRNPMTSKIIMSSNNREQLIEKKEGFRVEMS